MTSIVARFLLARARSAARARRWSAAAEAYRRYLAVRADDGRAVVQWGHALKESGQFRAAREAYRRAALLTPADPEVVMQVGRIAELEGDRTAAIESFRAALDVDAAFDPAITALVALGEREHLPAAVQRRNEREDGLYALSRYEAWRQGRTLPPVPQGPRIEADVLIEAVGASQGALDTTLRSLLALVGVRSITLAGDRSPALKTHGLASFDAGDLALVLERDAPMMILAAGTEAGPESLAWLGHALVRTGAGLAYADHDEIRDVGGHRPGLQPMYDPVWFRNAGTAPALLMLSPTVVATLRQCGGEISRAACLAAFAATHGAAHVPLCLARAPASIEQTIARQLTGEQHRGTIQVVIQTRDAADLLESCVETLIGKAGAADLLDIVIVDNRSHKHDTRRLLERWEAKGVARVERLDEPFNWSRANNRAARRSSAPLILFLNNDTEALSEGWDLCVWRHLADKATGVVGASLLYPDGTIQHAGVVLGMNGGAPIHEGVARAVGDGGPQGRWHRTRQVSAVTGAWMAMRREVFELVGGFDEGLPVAYNDIDMCLRVRAAGLRVIQASDLGALHRESMTRGTLLSAEDLRRDAAALARLRARWGAALDRDPGYNPQWTQIGHPFDGLVSPRQDVVLDWLAASAGGSPWELSSTVPVRSPTERIAG